MKLKCQKCKKTFKPGKYARNVKYCSQKCRNRVYYDARGGADYQREYFYKRNVFDTRDKIKCEICGKYYRQVGSHVIQTHHITAREYREEYGFDVKKGQLPEDYRKLKAKQAKECGGIRNLKNGKKFWFKKGSRKAGRYNRSKQTLTRLKSLHLSRHNRTP